MNNRKDNTNPPVNPSHEREQALFNLATAKPATERAAFLDRECAEDRPLRARLEALLAAHDQSEGVLPEPAVRPTMKIEFSDAPDETIGQKIGRYKILEKVGEGGCGVVYVAEQTEPVRRRVALKVIKLGMDTKQVVARFEAERQALAMMDHPNIAKVFDAGTTDTGRPYFIMELVRGIRITDYCDQNNLSTKDRLDLFMKVCQAIQHAHQKGIIHRDIKPSNILVTLHDSVPVPKVIDFGIAKATEGKLTDATVYTQLHQFIGTPAYMSPEQAEMSGLDIDTRSDIYSLGVLLYELLTGKTPFDAQELMSQGIDAMRKTIREKEPARPSTKLATLQRDELTTTAKRRSVDSSKLTKLLQGDLDWIVMKCLEKDRIRRYDTANGLATDLKRHLSNEAVLARPPSSAYRFQKAFRRNKLAFTAAGAVAAALLLGIVISSWQAVRATHAKQEALAAQAQAVTAQASEKAQRQQAVTNEEQAVEAQAGEKIQRQKAEALAVENEKNYQTARQNLYAADMAEVAQRLTDNDFARARQLLKAQRPKPGEEDLRGVEWRYLWVASEGSQMVTLDSGNWGAGKVRVSPDGKLIATIFGDGKIKIWDRASLKRIATLESGRATTAAYYAMDFSPSGKELAAYYWNHVDFWDMNSLRLAKEIHVDTPEWPDDIDELAYSPSPDEKLALDSPQRVTEFYDAVTGGKLASLPEGGVMAFSRDGSRIATLHDSPKIWDVASGRLIRSLDAGSSAAICFSADGGTVFLGGYYRGVQVWNVGDGTLETNLPSQASFLSLALSPDGKLLACGATDGRIELWDWKKRQLLRILRGHESCTQSLAFTPDGGTLVSGSADGTVRLWNVQPAPAPSQEVIARVAAFESGSSQGSFPKFSADGKWLATCCAYGIQVVDVEQNRVRSLLPTHALPIGFLPDGHTLLALGVSRINQTNAPEYVATQLEYLDWEFHTDRAVPLSELLPVDDKSGVALSADGTQMALVVCVPGDNTFHLFSINPTTGQCSPLDVTFPWANAGGLLAFSPDGHYLAVANGKIFLCDWPQVTNFISLTNRAEAGTERDGTRLAEARSAFFSRDGTRLMAGDNQGDVRVWIVPSDTLVFEPASQGIGFNSGAFSADGLTLATVTDTARLWNLHTGRELMSFDDTYSISFTPDGKVMAQVRSDGRLYLAHLPALQDIDHPPPQSLEQSAEAMESAAGVFKPVTIGNDVINASTNLTRIGFKYDYVIQDPDKISALVWGGSGQKSDPAWFTALQKKTGLKDLGNERDDGTWQIFPSGQPFSDLTDLSLLRGAPISHLNLNHSGVSDLAPLRGMPLEVLELGWTPVTDLSPLHGMPLLGQLSLDGTPVSDLSPLRGVPLRDLTLAGCTNLTDLSPLAGMTTLETLVIPRSATNIEILQGLTNLALIGFEHNPPAASVFWADYDKKQMTDKDLPVVLSRMGVKIDRNVLKGEELNLNDQPIADLSPLRGMALIKLHLEKTKVTDLTPLHGMRLESLFISGSQVADLSPLRGMPLKNLRMADCTNLTDLSPLAGMMTLETVILPPNATHIEALRGLTSLKRIGFKYDPTVRGPDKTAAQFWAEYDKKQMTGTDLPAVLSRMGVKFNSKMLKGEELDLNGQPIADISPLHGMTLIKLHLEDTKVMDLTPLQGMRLEGLFISGTQVADLSPLRGMPLKNLRMADCANLTDLSPLAGMTTLAYVILPPNATHIEALRGLTNLKRIGFKYDPQVHGPDKTAAQFWAEYDAKNKAGNSKP